MAVSIREQRRPMWTQHEKAVLRLLMREYAGVTEYDPPDIHKHPIKNEMWRLLTNRYNEHPNVRTRDTKQLRKAWENLKYRARKMGEIKKTGLAKKIQWPLDGVALAIVKKQCENGEFEDDDDEESKEVPTSNDRNGIWFPNNNNNKIVAKREPSPEKDSPEPPSPQLGFTDSLFNRVTSELCSDILSANNRNGSSNLQPLVSSLLLPLLQSSSSLTPSELLLNNPFHNINFGNLNDDCLSSSSKERSNVSIVSPDEDESWVTKSIAAAPSAAEVKLGLLNVKQEVLSLPSSVRESPVEEDIDNESNPSFIEQKILDLQSKHEHQNEQHLSTIRWLNLQISQAEDQHELKIKILEAQLQYWKAKLSLLSDCSDSKSVD